MKKNVGLKKLIAAIALGFSFLGCHDPSEIGFDLGGSGDLTAIYSDTVSLKYSTVISDSVNTSNSFYVLSGKTTDPVFGDVEAVAYFQPSLTPQFNTSGTIITDASGNTLYDTLSLAGSNPVLDSLRLRLYCNGLIYGDTNAVSKFTVHRISQVLEKRNYNNSEKVAYDSTPLAEFEVSLPNLRNDSTGIIAAKFVKLPTNIVQELINEAVAANGNNATFTNKFKGFAIVPDKSNKAVYGFSTGSLDLNGANSSLIPYWHFGGDTTSTLSVFNINGQRYSNLSFDRSNTALAALSSSNNEISFEDAGERLFLQAGSGISTKIDLSALENLGNIKIAKAVLEFRQDASSMNSLFRKSYFQVLAEVGNNNQQHRNADGFNTYIGDTNHSLTGKYYLLSDTTTYFNVDITEYLQKISMVGKENKEILLMPAVAYSNTVYGALSNDNLSRLVFLKPRLLLYYNRN